MNSPGDDKSANRTVVGNVMRFLSPEAARTLAHVSRSHKSSVQEADTNLTYKRRVEAHLGHVIEGDVVQDWKLTYDLLTTSPVALYYTGQPEDNAIAEKAGAKPIYERGPALGLRIDKVVEKGHVAAFKVLLNHFEDRLLEADYELFARNALSANSLEILKIPEVTAGITSMEGDDRMDQCIVDIASENIFPVVADYFLAHAHEFAQLDGNLRGWEVYTVIKDGKYSIVKVFLKYGIIDPSTVSINVSSYPEIAAVHGDQLNPIWLASKYGYDEIIRLFLQDERVKALTELPFDISAAAGAGHLSTVKLLLEDGRVSTRGSVWIAEWDSAEYNEGDPVYDNSPIFSAVTNGRLEVVRFLLSHPEVDPSVSNNSLLVIAVMNNYTEIALLILQDKRVRPSAQQASSLIQTAEYNDNQLLADALSVRWG